MSRAIQHINELHELVGGTERYQATGNVYPALVNFHFNKRQEDGTNLNTLIFALLEIVDLSNTNISGKGTTYIYSPFEDTQKNWSILNTYAKIIDEVKEKQQGISAFKKWYEQNTYLYLKENENPKIKHSNNSTWRFNWELPTVPKDRDEYNYLDLNPTTGEPFTDEEFENYVRSYLTLYIDCLESQLGFADYPYYSVVVRPIAARGKEGTFALGNLYLHFATTEPKDERFYARFLNDFLYAWMRKEGVSILKIVQDDAVQETKKAIEQDSKSHFPALWTDTCSLKFDADVIGKIDRDFQQTGFKLSYFFDLLHQEFQQLLQEKERVIIEDFLPALLKSQGFLKAGVNCNATDAVFERLNPRAQHTLFKQGPPENFPEFFLRILIGRHIINLCCCLFGFTLPEVHGFMITDGSERLDKSGEGNYEGRLRSYVTQYFIYAPVGSTYTHLTQHAIYLSASKKEIQFLEVCVGKLQQLMIGEKLDLFNETCYDKLKLSDTPLEAFRNDIISRDDIADFKQNYCDENKIIAHLLKTQAKDFLVAPILDCGAGLGDIAYRAFGDKAAILIDVNPVNVGESPISSLHKEFVIDFFDFFSEEQINTVLISHTLQFIDSKQKRLNKKLAEIGAKYVIVVINANDGTMGEVLDWTQRFCPHANPEVRLEDFPQGYKLIKEIPFQAQLQCEDFHQLAEQISYLMMFDLQETGTTLEKWLEAKLDIPGFSINQFIEIYEKLEI